MSLFNEIRARIPPNLGMTYMNNPVIHAPQTPTTQFGQMGLPPTSGASSPNLDEPNEGNSKRKRRLEIKNKSETKRRNKFNDQLTSLKSLLDCDAEEAKGLTRDQVMSKAIQEIQRLKNLIHNQQATKHSESTNSDAITSNDTHMIVTLNGAMKKSLNDPFNRYPWTKEDLDTTFHVLYAKEFLTIFRLNRTRTSDVLMGSIKSLYDIAEQTGKLEYKLYVSVIEEVFYSTVVPNAKEFKRVLDKNLALYNQVKTERNVQEVVLARGEISVLLFGDFAMYHLATGNVAESDRIWQFAFKLSQQIVNYTTRNFLLIGIPSINYFRGSIASLEDALKYKELMKYDSTCKESAKLMLAQVYSKHGQYEEAVKYAEDGISQLLDSWGDTADVLMGPILVDILIKAGKLDRALTSIINMLKKCDEINIEGFGSKAELYRLKAKILFMKIKQQINFKIQQAAMNNTKGPSPLDNTLPHEDPLYHVDNIAVHLNFNDLQSYDQSTIATNSNNQIVSKGPADLVQVELLLQHATQIAKQKGMLTVELRCAVDAAEVWLAFGDEMQKLEALHSLESICEQMQQAQQLEEYQTAQKLIAELKAHIVCLFPSMFVQ